MVVDFGLCAAVWFWFGWLFGLVGTMAIVFSHCLFCCPDEDIADGELLLSGSTGCIIVCIGRRVCVQ